MAGFIVVFIFIFCAFLAMGFISRRRWKRGPAIVIVITDRAYRAGYDSVKMGFQEINFKNMPVSGRQTARDLKVYEEHYLKGRAAALAEVAQETKPTPPSPQQGKDKRGVLRRIK
ncbi:MAG: hypothetical protein Q7S32_00975 [bacterium]|nr:hypothetical protein [bacterium]